MKMFESIRFGMITALILFVLWLLSEWIIHSVDKKNPETPKTEYRTNYRAEYRAAKVKLDKPTKPEKSSLRRQGIGTSCPKCEAPLESNSKFCPNCGAQLKEKKCCSGCGAKLTTNAKFCPECGKKIE